MPDPGLVGPDDGPAPANRGGNRKANAALHRVVIVRLKWHEPTRAYMARRTAEGRTKKDVIRCLKRYVARELFRLLPREAERAPEKVAVGG